MNRQYISGMVTGALMILCVLLGFVLANVNTSMFGQQPTPTPPNSATRPPPLPVFVVI